jgi:hypothetical protein
MRDPKGGEQKPAEDTGKMSLKKEKENWYSESWTPAEENVSKRKSSHL